MQKQPHADGRGMRLYVFVRECVLAELGSMRVTRQP